MTINFLDYIPLEVRKLQSMDKHSKDYRKAIKGFHFKYGKQLSMMIKHDKSYGFSHAFRNKYRRNFFSSICVFVISLIFIFLIIQIIGDKEANELSKLEVTTLISLTLAGVVVYSIGMILIVKARKVMVDYIKALIDQTKIRCSHFSEQLLSDVSAAYSYTHNNRQLMNAEEKCGCIKCVRIFNSNEINNHNSKSVICPYCNTESVIGESSGFLISQDFLNAMRDYWIDNTD